jgi:hypothetical protein
MTTAGELLRQGRRDEIWKKYCGFIDLSLEEFMEIQERLLMEQIQLLGKCELGRKLLRDRLPTSVEEFRQMVPLTTYADYLPYLAEKREDVLPEKPVCWVRTSGRSGEYAYKWAPVTKRHYEEEIGGFLASVIFATCRGRGDIALEEHDKFLYGMAPPPYVTGMIAPAILQEFPFDFLPPAEKAEKASFQERIEMGFNMALREGLDIFFGIGSILVSIGERFSQETGKVRISSAVLHPKAFYRLMRGLIRSRIVKRPMTPADLWNLKGIITGGMDAAVFRDVIEYYWGKSPIEFYGSAESALVAVQTWDRKGFTFVPDTNFLEFIPEEEHLKLKRDPDYRPRIILLNELQSGEKYEIVVTRFKGGIFVRYRVGDIIRISALRNEKLDIDIPQMVFETRADDVIDVGGFTWLTEKAVWQAIEETRIGYVDWTATKIVEEQQPMLHLYIELKESSVDKEQFRLMLHEKLCEVDISYDDIDKMLGLKPLRVTLLSPGTFHRYYLERQAAGADLAELKPPHMRPSEVILHRLLRFSEGG